MAIIGEFIFGILTDHPIRPTTTTSKEVVTGPRTLKVAPWAMFSFSKTSVAVSSNIACKLCPSFVHGDHSCSPQLSFFKNSVNTENQVSYWAASSCFNSGLLDIK